jgi:phosphoglycolate phosphatase
VLFDLDGTLTDPLEGIVGSLRFAFEAIAAPTPSDTVLAGCIGPPLGDTFVALLPDPTSERIERAIGHYRERFGKTGWSENEVYPHVPDLLAAVGARGWRASVATSKPTVFAERITRHFALRDHFGAVYGSELDGTRSAKADLLAHVLATEGADPARTVMIGDRRHDVEGAKAVGVTSIGVTWGYGPRDELVRAGADFVCDSAGQVMASLDAVLGAA